ncbi:hypothetical protein ETB97_009695 [Aspergillus alliaceus]|uniref:Uncharacterized protein n=1 Tax=Petromyces alliaceus TaxID=209559 RepID=A0A8H6AAN5_PETAA|nr:hypothetical protein ETB97_009695 [Aspergillus burnettii]
MIDDVSLRTIDRGTLRRRIIAVPEDATFFPDGTSFRTNLDPFAEIADAEYQAVLEPEPCSEAAVEPGPGRSPPRACEATGRRGRGYTLCLRKDVGGSRPSSLRDDPGVAAVRDLIWGEFEGYTVVMVGHRLDLVLEFDKVLVMDAGRLVEEGSPRQLITEANGWF